MEQVPGGSLSSLIREKWGPLIDNENAMAFYTQQICEGVRYLHAQKIVHRDIKGDNVLVNTYNGCCKLSDFGTSKRLAGINPLTKTFAGTMQFMAPEVIDQGQRGYGPAADIWSVGCTVVEMATGKPPFFELEPAAAIFKVGMFKTHPEIPEQASEDCVKFLKRCFDPHPEERATADDLLLTSFIILRTKRKKKKESSNLKVTLPPQRGISLEPGLLNNHSPPSDDSGHGTSNTNSVESPKDNPMILNFRQSESMDNLAGRSQGFETDMSRAIFKSKSMSRVNSEPIHRISLDHSPMMSPGSPASPASSSYNSNDEFYQINQQYQRKTLLLSSLKTYKREICDTWMKRVNDLSPSSQALLSETCFNYLLEATIEYVERPTQDITAYIGPIQRDHPLDTFNVLHEIQLSFHLVAEVISEIMRKYLQILPHWMFAIDTIIRDAVKRALEDVNQEMKSHHIGEVQSEGGSVNGGDTTPTSERRQVRFLSRDNSLSSDERLSLLERVQMMSEENSVLLQELSDLHITFNKLLSENVTSYSSFVSSQRQQSIKIKELHDKPAYQINNQESHDLRSSDGGPPDILINSPPPIKGTVNLATFYDKKTAKDHDETDNKNVENKLISWLKSLNVPDGEINKFIVNECTYQDVYSYFTWEDLKDLQLKIGPRTRVWSAIKEIREKTANT